MLCGHERLFVPPEAWFLGDMICSLPPQGALGTRHLKACEDIILRSDRWKDWQCPDEKLRRILQECEGLELAAVIDKLFRGVFDLHSDVRWGEKSPRHSYLVKQIDGIFHGCQFIHIIRDGRDVASSMLARGWYAKSSRRVAEHWQTCVEAARQAAAFGPSRYLEVRFEELVTEPAKHLERICVFLGVDFRVDMVAFQNLVQDFVPTGEIAYHEKLQSGLKNSEIGKWKDFLTPWQEAVFWIVAWRQTKAYYPAAKPRWGSRLLFPMAALFVFLDRFKSVVVSKFALPRQNMATDS